MKVFKFFVQAENGFHVCIASVNGIDIQQAIYFFEKNIKKVKFNEIVKIERL
jgi:hypothetical protein